LREVYLFGERAGIAQHNLHDLDEIDPLSILAPDRIDQCDEAFVAECDGRVVGAATLAFNGVYAPKRPTLDALYLIPEFRGRGIGFALLERAIRRFIEVGKCPVLCKAESAEMGALLERLGARLPELGEHIDAKLDFLAH